jgi:hypothetical protein
MVGLRSDTESMPRISSARNAWRSVVAVDYASEGAGAHPSTYIAAPSLRSIRTTPALVAPSDYRNYPRFPPSTPMIFRLFSSDFTDLARVVNTLTLHVATAI